MTSNEILIRIHEVEADNRAIQRRLQDGENPPSFADRQSLKAEIPKNQKVIATLRSDWRSAVLEENTAVLTAAEASLEKLRPAVERAHHLILSAPLFIGADDVAGNPEIAKTQQKLADAHKVIYERDDLIMTISRAHVAISESRAA